MFKNVSIGVLKTRYLIVKAIFRPIYLLGIEQIKNFDRYIYMNRQDLVYLHHTLKNANTELKNIRRKFDREKNKILKKSRKGANKTRKKKRH
jgi:hypothetical protein